MVWAALQWRFSILLLLIVVSPYRPDLRLLAIDTADARVCSRWLAVYLAVNPLNVFLIWLVERLGFGQETVFGAALALGVVITVYKVAMFLAIRGPIARAILAATGRELGPLRRAVAAWWHWFFIALALGIFCGGNRALSGEGRLGRARRGRNTGHRRGVGRAVAGEPEPDRTAIRR